MELGLEQEQGFDRVLSPQPSRPVSRPRRPNRAHWWFERMRQIVDDSLDYQAAGPKPLWPSEPSRREHG
jgi:hypothetical protein